MASGGSSRFSIPALLAVPLASLMALWGFAVYDGVGEALALRDLDTVRERVVEPGERLTLELQREHVLSAEFIAVRADRGRAILDEQRARTDRARDELRQSIRSAEDALTPPLRARAADLMEKVDRIDALRASIDRGRPGLITLSHEFGLVPDAVRLLAGGLPPGDDPVVHRDVRGLTAMAQAKDLLTRERALAAGVLAVGRRMSAGELRAFTTLATNRAFLFEQGLADLEPGLRGPFLELAETEEFTRLATAEERLLARSARLSHAEWRTVTDRVDVAFHEGIGATAAAIAAREEPAARAVLIRTGVLAGAGPLAVLASVLIGWLVSRRLSRERSRPQGVTPAPEKGARDTAAAEGDARLRETVWRALRTLVGRNQTLLQRQLRLLRSLPRDIGDEETAARLRHLNQLTIRMQRHAERIVILSGGSSGRTWPRPLPVRDVLGAAVAGVEDNHRVRVHPMPGATVAGAVVPDVVHLFAELIENAVVFSPANTEVTVRGVPADGGFTIEVDDRGLGLPPDRLAALNAVLADPPPSDPSDTYQLGLAVVARIAAERDLRVRLSPSPYGGITAVVRLPGTVVTLPEPVAGEEAAKEERNEDDQDTELVAAVSTPPEEAGKEARPQ